MIDPRAHSPTPLVPPAPLPHVSRKALKRVKDVMPVPQHCRYCDGPVALVSNAAVYRGREYGDWPYLYWCEDCDAYVGLHPNTDIPLGTLANQELREARKAGKALFIAVQQRSRWNRDKAYAWLARQLGIDPAYCHWGWFEPERCQQASEVCQRRLDSLRRDGR
jgi:hypothetical protein